MRINIYGGPGVGKSTTAALIFGWLRQQGHNAELAQEWVKAWAYQGRTMQSFDYVFTFANQLHTEDRLLQAGVEIIVTDSPIYLQCMYALHHRMKAANELWRIAKRFEQEYPSINFFVKREVPYDQQGRFEDEKQARIMDRFILDCLEEWAVEYTRVPPGDLEPVLKVLRKVLK